MQRRQRLQEDRELSVSLQTRSSDLEVLVEWARQGEAVVEELVTGLDGSPMNAYDHISNFELWNLIHFLQSKQAS